MKNYIQNRWSYPLALLLIMVVAYGLQITRLGFYWDDWQAIFLAQFKTPLAFWQYYFSDRPLSAWTYILTVPLLGVSPLPWHLFTLTLRWLSVLSLVWALNGVWPRHTWQIRWIGFLFALYPGFSQQAVSVAYSQHFISYALFTTSLGLMVWAHRQPERFTLYTALAFFTSLLQLGTMEYFFGLELLRPFILWILNRNKGESLSRTAARVMKRWLPYLAVLILFFGWRFFAYPALLSGPDENPPLFLNELLNSPLPATLDLLEAVIQDAIHMLLFVWMNTIHPDSIDLNAKATLLSWFIGLAAAIGLFCYWKLSSPGYSADDQEIAPIYKLGFLLGPLAILFGGIPVWITERQITVGLWSDRFSLAPMLGVSILVVSFVDWIARDQKRSAILLALLAGISIAYHFRNSNKYRLNWELQRDYYWQMVWRAPDLTPGTAILGPKYPFSLVADYSVAFAYNILYSDPFEMSSTPYWFIPGPWEISKEDLTHKINLPIESQFRNISFKGNTLTSLGVAHKPTRGCLLVLDDIYRLAPQITEEEASLFPISHPQQIRVPAIPVSNLPVDFLGKEPPHQWCYYFQKADLARQMEDWQSIQILAESAESSGFEPGYSAELTPFIEAYIHLGDYEKAVEMTLKANRITSSSENFLCGSWARILNKLDNPPESEIAYMDIKQVFDCKTRLQNNLDE